MFTIICKPEQNTTYYKNLIDFSLENRRLPLGRSHYVTANKMMFFGVFL